MLIRTKVISEAQQRFALHGDWNIDLECKEAPTVNDVKEGKEAVGSVGMIKQQAEKKGRITPKKIWGPVQVEEDKEKG